MNSEIRCSNFSGQWVIYSKARAHRPNDYEKQPCHLRQLYSIAEKYLNEYQRCIYCHTLEWEYKEQERIVDENNHFVALVPYAAEVPYHMWIVPKAYQSDFSNLTDEQKTDFAAILRNSIRRLDHCLHDPDYNYVIITSGYQNCYHSFHWYLDLRARLTTSAGFELGTQIPINPSLPEEDALRLRRTQIEP